MRRLTLMVALAIAGITFSYAPGAALATPDPSARVLRAANDGWERPPRFLSSPAARRERGKRCEGCGGLGRIDRVPHPGRTSGSSDPGIPEPGAALLFGIGLLAIRSGLRLPLAR